MGGKLIPTAVILTTLFGVVACSGSNSSDDGNSDPGTQMPGQTAENAQGWQTIDMIADQAETKLDSLGHFDTSRNACGHEAYGILDLTLWNNIASESNQVLAAPALSEDHMNCFDSPDGNRMDGTVDFILVSPAPAHDLEPDTHSSPAPHPTSTPTATPTATPTSRPTSTPTSTPSTHPSPSPSPSPSIAPKRSIYEVRGGQVCTTIQDTQLAKDLLKNISTFVDLANKQDCANGYGN
jgi:cell division septation protein DedD